MRVGVLGPFLFELPVYLVWLIGIILAVIYWQRQPRVALLTLIALVLFFADSLVGGFLSVRLPLMLREQRVGIRLVTLFAAVRGIVQVLVSVVAWGLVLAAIFGGRGKQEASGPTLADKAP